MPGTYGNGGNAFGISVETSGGELAQLAVADGVANVLVIDEWWWWEGADMVTALTVGPGGRSCTGSDIV